MRTRGVKVCDPVLAADQLDWFVVSTTECPDTEAEQRVINAYFRRPHGPWGGKRAFVLPVTVRRSRRRVLFCQRSGLERFAADYCPVAFSPEVPRSGGKS